MRARTGAIGALAWKEWREQRGVLFAGLAVSLILPPFIMMLGAAGLAPVRDGMAGVLVFLIAGLVWPVFALLAGAGTFAGETAAGTLAYLLTRPVSRLTIWCVKVASGAAVVAGIACGSALVAWVFLAMTSPTPGPALLGALDDTDLAPFAAAVCVPLLFGTACFFSTFMPRPLTAAGAALVGAAALCAAILSFWLSLDLQPLDDPILLLGHLGAITLIVLGAAWGAFRGREGGTARRGLAVGGACLIVCMAVSIGIVAALDRLPIARAEAWVYDVDPHSGAAALTVQRDGGNSPRIWIVHADGGGAVRLTPRLTRQPAFSPDGARIAYWSLRSWTGLASSEYHLRVMRADGTEDRRVAGGHLHEEEWHDLPWVVFSPDSDGVAFLADDRIVLAALEGEADGSSIFTEDLFDTPFEGGRLLGWRADGRALVLLAEGEDERTRVGLFDLTSGSLRTVAAIDRPLYSLFTGGDSPPLTHVPVVVWGEGEEEDLVLVDLAHGTHELVARSVSAWSVRLSRSGRVLIWAECAGTQEAGRRSVIRSRDLDTGEERVLAGSDRCIGMLTPSPDGRRVAFPARRNGEDDTLVWGWSAGDGTIDLPADWVPAGWAGRSRLLVQRGFGEPVLALLDLETGAWSDLTGAGVGPSRTR